MLRRLLTLAVVLSAGARFGASAETPQTRSLRVWITPHETENTKGTLKLRAIMGPLATMELPLSSPADGVSFAVPPRTMWEVLADIPGWWAAPMPVAVQDVDVEATLTLVPTGNVTGHLVAPKNGTPLTELSVKIDPLPGIGHAKPAGESRCSVAEDAAFVCEVPVGTIDLSLHVAGYVSAYRWGVKVARHTNVELGAVTLSNGSAVTGFLRLNARKIEAGKGRVALFVPTPGTSPTSARLGRPVAQAVVAENGFFGLRDVPPGRYALLATYPGFSSATLEGINVYRGTEAKLARVIELQPPVALVLKVDPPLDFSGRPWRLELSRETTPGKYASQPAFDGEMKGGEISLTEQERGRYRAQIRDAAGNPFLDEEFTTSGAADDAHTFKIEAVRVRGTLRRGEQPVEAALWFGGRFGDTHAALRSNARGEFHGILPHAGTWRVVVETKTAEAELRADVDKPEDQTKEVAVSLTLPATRITGLVVDGSGTPAADANVQFVSGATVQTQRSDPAGSFTFDGVPAGSFTLMASREDRAALKVSDAYKGTIADDQALGDIVLSLTDGHSIHGRVLARNGPVVGADVKLRPGSGNELSPVTRATAGADGVFDISVAPGFDRALVTVSAAGYALRVFDIPVDGRAVTLNLPDAGGSLQVQLPQDANGFALFQDGRFLSFGDVANWMRMHGDALPTAANLNVLVTDIAPARYRACTGKKNAATLIDLSRCAEGLLLPYGELQLKIE